MRYFRKIYPQQPVTLVNGKGFTFPATSAGVGLLAVDPSTRPDLVRSFEILMARQRGGITEIDQQTFEAEKKKTPPPPRASEALTREQVLQLRRVADRENAERADKERAKRQLTPTINRSFKRPGMKYAGATENPQPGGTQPGQWRPGISNR